MSQVSEEMDIAKLKQNVRDHLEKVFLEQDKALAKSAVQKNDNKKKLEHIEAQKKELMKKLEQSEAKKNELQEKNVQSEAQKKELQKKHEQSEAQKKELQKKHEQSEAQKKELQKKHEQCEAQKKELQKKFEQSESHNKDLQIKLDHSEAQKKELQKKLEQSEAQKNELEVRKQREIQLMKQMYEETEVKDVKQEKIDEVQEQDQYEVKDDEDEELDNAEVLSGKLIEKEIELQETREELINGWDSTSHAFIGVKRIGELESKPFETACNRKYPMYEADDQAASLCFLWEDYLRDASWEPFTTIRGFRGQSKTTIDKGDEKLKNLKYEFGDEVYNAVTTALLELNEYNPMFRYPIPELWNFKQVRRASLKEGVSFLLKQLKLQKRRRSS